MFQFMTLLAGGLPNVQPDYNTPASPLVTKLEELAFGLTGIGIAFVFIYGLWMIAVGVTGHREGGVGRGVLSIIVAGMALAALSGGTAFLNTWASWFSA